jgi:hypothetical protein
MKHIEVDSIQDQEFLDERVLNSNKVSYTRPVPQRVSFYGTEACTCGRERQEDVISDFLSYESKHYLRNLLEILWQDTAGYKQPEHPKALEMSHVSGWSLLPCCPHIGP